MSNVEQNTLTRGHKFLSMGEAPLAHVEQAIANRPSWVEEIDPETGTLLTEFDLFHVRGSRGWVHVIGYAGLTYDTEGAAHLAVKCKDPRKRKVYTEAGPRMAQDFTCALAELRPDRDNSEPGAIVCVDGERSLAARNAARKVRDKANKRREERENVETKSDKKSARPFTYTRVGGNDAEPIVRVESDPAVITLGDGFECPQELPEAEAIAWIERETDAAAAAGLLN